LKAGVVDLRVIADGIFFLRTSKLMFEAVMEEDGLRNKLEMGCGPIYTGGLETMENIYTAMACSQMLTPLKAF